MIQDKLYVVGGFNGFSPVADLEVYDPATNTWRTLAPIPTAGQAIGAVVLGKLFVITSGGGQLRSYAYTPSTNMWKARAAPAMGHDGVVRITLQGSNYLLAVGGSHGFELADPNPSELYPVVF